MMSDSEPRAKDESWTEQSEKPAGTKTMEVNVAMLVHAEPKHIPRLMVTEWLSMWVRHINHSRVTSDDGFGWRYHHPLRTCSRLSSRR